MEMKLSGDSRGKGGKGIASGGGTSKRQKGKSKYFVSSGVLKHPGSAPHVPMD